MADTSNTIRHISWRDLFPWFILFRTFRIAISPSLLTLATVAVLLAPVGWRAADLLFQPRRPVNEGAQRVTTSISPSDAGTLETEPAGTWRQRIPGSDNSQLKAETPPAARQLLPALPTALLEAYYDLAEPVRRCFQLKMSVRETAYYAFGALWMLALWSFPGGVITRRAIVQLATDAAPSVTDLTLFAGRRYFHYLLAPLYPLLGVIVLALPIAALGVPIRWWPELGSMLAGLAWIFVALAGMAAMWLLGGILFGWPLMWPTISAERDGDSFEAFSRSYSYVFGKPLHYFFYVVVAALFGTLCWAIVETAAVLVREFGFWALALGGGGKNVEAIRTAAIAWATTGIQVESDSRLLPIGTTLIGLVLTLIQSVAVAFRYTYFFCVASAIYLLMRQDVDEKEMDEVSLEKVGVKASLQSDSPPAAAASHAD